MAISVILKLPGTDGISAMFEVAPAVGDLIELSPDGNASTSTFRVKAVTYALNQLTNTYSPMLDLIEQRIL